MEILRIFRKENEDWKILGMIRDWVILRESRNSYFGKNICFIASPFFLKAKSLVALLLQCRWICRGWAASPAAGSPVNPLHFLLPLLISYFPCCCKIISHNLADNLKFWQKSENSVFIKKLRQLNSTLYLSQVTPTDTSLVTSGKTRRTNKNTNCVCVPGSVVSWLLFFCTTASCTSSHTTLSRRQVQVQRLVALPHEQFRSEEWRQWRTCRWWYQQGQLTSTNGKHKQCIYTEYISISSRNCHH